MKNKLIYKEDYLEPQCLLCTNSLSKPSESVVPVNRILSKYDELMERQDFGAAERHLKYWLNEAIALSDKRGEFAVRNESMGFYRMRGKTKPAIEHAGKALELISEIGLTGSVTEGTCLLNSATVFDAAGEINKSIELFERAEAVYIAVLPEGDNRFAGLYNNYGLALLAAKRYDDALNCFTKALKNTSDSPRGRLEQAITHLNMADVYSSCLTPDEAEEKISSCLDTAVNLLSSSDIPDDGYYAFVCEKCAPVLKYYGRFADAEEISAKSQLIYENIRNM